MTEAIQRLHHQAGVWLERAQSAGWLSESDGQRLRQVEQRTPADLFTDNTGRPLVVAFFGGTGVGKSSLLNRLAGEPIARVGVERPTSHEVTVYLHEAIELAELPPELPLAQVHIARHADPARRDVLWIDMPDIDSTEQRNRALVFAWLVHVDLLIYVVSPERYRDDVGWRVLRERGHRHGWLFVMNHWDEGAPEQLDDFTAMLREAGFRDPLVIPTCCGTAPCADDRFATLESSIRALQAQHGQQELERLGQRARLDDLAGAIQSALERFGTEQAWRRLHQDFEHQFTATQAALLDGMTWPIAEIAADFGSRDRGMLAALVGDKPGTDAAPDTESAPASGAWRAVDSLWDKWAQDKLTETSDSLEVALRNAGCRPHPVLQYLQPVIENAGTTIQQQLRESLRAGLARPGTRLQRALRRLSGIALALLPIAALIWVAVHVVIGFSRGTAGEAEFLGTNFAVNSVLLVLSAWLLPYLLHRRLKPSLEKTAARALRNGLTQGLEDVKTAAAAALASADEERSELVADANELLREIHTGRGGTPSAQGTEVARLLTTAAH